MATKTETPVQDTTKTGEKKEGTTVLSSEKPKADTTKADEGKKEEQKQEEKPKVEGSEETGTKVEDGSKQEKPKAPEKYELQRPEDETYTDADIARIETTAKALGLTNDQAQAMLDAEVEEMGTLRETFLRDLKADKDLGGGNLEVSVDLARRGIKAFISESPADEQAAINAMLENTGYGNHKALVRAFARLGKMMQEDDVDSGGKSGAKERKSDAQAFYGTD